MEKVVKYTNRIGRVLFSLIFIASGLSKIVDWDKTSSYMEANNMKFIPFFLIIAIAFQVLGGLSIILNYKIKIGIVLLLIFMVPATFIFHDFWTLVDTTEIEETIKQLEMVSFLKNSAIIGALLMLFSEKNKQNNIPLSS